MKSNKLVKKNTNLNEVAEGLGGSSGGGENIINPRELQHLLGNPSRHDPRTSRRGNHPNGNGAALPRNLARDGVGLPDLVPPVPPPHGDNRQLRQNNRATNSCRHFLAALHAQPDVAVVVSDDDEGLEPGPLPGPGLLLDRRDLHHLVLEGGTHERVDDLVLLDRERVEVDLFKASDSSLLHQAAQFGHWDPLLLFLAAGASAPASAPVTSASSPAESTSETATVAATFATSALCH